MNQFLEHDIRKTMARRAFLKMTGLNLGSVALASLLNQKLFGASPSAPQSSGTVGPLHFAPRAKRVIYLFMSGAPSQIDLYDPKPKLRELTGQLLPESVRMGQRITGMTSGQKYLLCVGSPFEFKRYGHCGTEMSELLPHIGSVADEIALLRAVHTDPINHDPAVTYLFTGNQQPGRPTLGAWVSYGLGSENSSLPAFIVMISGRGGQSLQTRYWGNGFLPSNHQGVQFRGQGDPVLFLSDPPGLSQETRRRMLDHVQALNRLQLGQLNDPEIATRIEAYEMAFRMQTSVPELMDISNEPKEVLELYGAEPGKPSFANNCLLARRLAERGVRFINLLHRDWDHHGGLPQGIRQQTSQTDKASAALIKDLKSRGLLDETLVVWGGEFGRTAYSQGNISKDSFGRDHHPRCYSLWLAGGGIKGGVVHGVTDDFSYNIASGGVHINDLHATILHCLGIDHERLTYRFQGRDFRLTDVAGKVVKEILV
ncbi:MAG: DUF1501 domain-containing protein [Verrucomicrobia bacterium]|nr:DUF1501 domain-containing protein [Verrucomicrobiota bacterium]